MKTNVILIGGGGHCRSCIDVIESQGIYSILGIIDKTTSLTVLPYPLLGSDYEINYLFEKNKNFIITLGQIKTPVKRIEIFKNLISLGANLPTIISPHAYIAKRTQIGIGNMIMHGSIINASAAIGDNCIINTQALIEHEVEVQSNCHISTGAKINGAVKIGQGSFIGSGAIIREGLKIGANSIIGAGVVVFNDVPENTKIVSN